VAGTARDAQGRSAAGRPDGRMTFGPGTGDVCALSAWCCAPGIRGSVLCVAKRSYGAAWQPRLQRVRV
jgi:hypothetical protein